MKKGLLGDGIDLRDGPLRAIRFDKARQRRPYPQSILLLEMLKLVHIVRIASAVNDARDADPIVVGDEFGKRIGGCLLVDFRSCSVILRWAAPSNNPGSLAGLRIF